MTKTMIRRMMLKLLRSVMTHSQSPMRSLSLISLKTMRRWQEGPETDQIKTSKVPLDQAADPDPCQDQVDPVADQAQCLMVDSDLEEDQDLCPAQAVLLALVVDPVPCPDHLQTVRTALVDDHNLDQTVLEADLDPDLPVAKTDNLA